MEIVATGHPHDILQLVLVKGRNTALFEGKKWCEAKRLTTEEDVVAGHFIYLSVAI